MRLEDLKVFIAVGDHGSMIKAADILHLSQQTISATIKSLETELGKTLFKRSKSGTQLTSDGKITYDAVRSILTQIDALYAKPDDTIDTKRILSIHFTYQPGFNQHITALTQALKKHYPKSNIFAETMDAYIMNTRLKENATSDQLDPTIYMTTVNEERLYEYKQAFANYNVYLVSNSHLKLLAGTKSPLSPKKQISLYSLSKYPLAFYSVNTNQKKTFFTDLLSSYGVFCDTSLITNDTDLITQYIASNLVYAVSSAFPGELQEKGQKLIPITPKINIMQLALFPKVLSEDIAICERLFVDTFGSSITYMKDI